MDDLRTRADLIDALGNDGCAICRLVHEHTVRQIDTLNYECVMDPDVRLRVKRAAGFCRDHGGLWYEHASKLATAQIYGDVLDRATDDLRQLSFAKRRTSDIVRGKSRQIDLVAEDSRCLVCVGADDTLRHLIKVFNRSLSDQRMRDALASGFICYDHGRSLLAHSPDGQAFDLVRNRLMDITQATRADLAEIVRKHDHRFSGEQAGPEIGAGARAINLVNGESIS